MFDNSKSRALFAFALVAALLVVDSQARLFLPSFAEPFHGLTMPRRFFDDFFTDEFAAARRALEPRTQVIEGDKENLLVVHMPGVAPERLEIKVKHDVLTISGKTAFCQEDDDAETRKKHEPLSNIEIVEEEEGEEKAPLQESMPRSDAEGKSECLYKQLERTYSASFRLHPTLLTKDVWAEEWHGVVLVHVPKVSTEQGEVNVPLVRSSGSQ